MQIFIYFFSLFWGSRCASVHRQILTTFARPIYKYRYGGAQSCLCLCLSSSIWWMDGARFNVPLDTKYVISETFFPANLWPEVLYSLHEIFVHVTHARGSVFLCRRCSTLCTSGFIDDVIFARAIWTGIPIPSQRVTSLRRRAQAPLRPIGCVLSGDGKHWGRTSLPW